MTNKARMELILNRLQNLNPDILELVDESEKHVGHPGAQSGGGHYALTIKSPLFIHKSLIECHRLIYEHLQEEMKKEIHALKIKIVN